MRLRIKNALQTPLYPFLFAIFSVFDYTTKHVADAQPLALAGTIVVVWLVTLGFLLPFVLVKDQHKRALVGWVLAITFLSYDQVQSSLEDTSHAGFLTHYHVQMVGTFVFIVVFLAVMARVRHVSATITGVLTLASLYLVATSGFHVWQAAQKQSKALAYVQPNVPTLTASSDQPDIYFLMLEEYTGPVGLKKLYNYDDQPFLDDLKKRGFYTADKATSNYYGSLHSIASSLNLDYLDAVTGDIPGKIDQHAVMQDLIENNAVATALQKAGYQYYEVGSWWEETRTSWSADHNLYLTTPYIHLPNLAVYYLTDQTIVGSFISKLWPLFKRHVLEYQLTTLPKLAAQTDAHPKFVFAHFLMPHRPIMYGENCRKLSVAETRDAGGIDKYLGQVDCANQLALQLIDDIQKNSKKPPIIILQSDEGQELIADEPSDQSQWSDQAILERMPIINAIYYPDKKYDALYPAISSVNTFRNVFDTYFGTKLGLKADQNFLLPNYYTLDSQFDVTERLKHLMADETVVTSEAASKVTTPDDGD